MGQDVRDFFDGRDRPAGQEIDDVAFQEAFPGMPGRWARDCCDLFPDVVNDVALFGAFT